MESTDVLQRTADLFKALSTTSRLRILTRLIEGPAIVGEIVDDTELSQSLVSQHLKMLRGMNLVRVERNGRNAVYSIADDHVSHVITDAVKHSKETSGP